MKINYISVKGIGDAEYDLLMGDITIKPSRAEIIDFSVPFQTSEIIIFKKQSKSLDTNVFSFLLPLSYKVWVAVLISLLLGSSFRASHLQTFGLILYPNHYENKTKLRMIKHQLICEQIDRKANSVIFSLNQMLNHF